MKLLTQNYWASHPTKAVLQVVGYAVLALFLLASSCSSVYTVPEGHIGIVKQFSKAKDQVDPGLHFKIPFIESVEEIEVRTRKNVEQMGSATAEQMPINAEVSVNWTVDPAFGIDLFRKYGGLAQFEARILDPRFRSSAKSALPKYTAEQLIQNRSQAISSIEENLIKEMEGFPVKVDNVQIENLVLPPKYIQSIETKQTEKNLAAAEQHKLDRQGLEAQQKVNTANAERDAAKAHADGVAYATLTEATAEAESIKMKGLAEAEAIEAKAKALKNNPLIVQLTHEQQWDGKLPTTVLGGSGALPLYNVK